MKSALLGVALCAIGGVVFWAKPQPVMPSPPGLGTDPGHIRAHGPLNPVAGDKLAAFSAGCFWGVEEAFRKTPGVKSTAVGYMGGTSANPDYYKAHSDGHAETVLVEYDPVRVSYSKLLEVFRDQHHFTGRVDPKSPYRSAIWTFDETQSKTATERMKKDLATVRIEPMQTFYLAEEEHQQYDEKADVRSCQP
ncbi:hypothetical protein BH11ARM1_BH11ARM1_17720 [soil metagenome]